MCLRSSPRPGPIDKRTGLTTLGRQPHPRRKEGNHGSPGGRFATIRLSFYNWRATICIPPVLSTPFLCVSFGGSLFTSPILRGRQRQAEENFPFRASDQAIGKILRRLRAVEKCHTRGPRHFANWQPRPIPRARRARDAPAASHLGRTRGRIRFKLSAWRKRPERPTPRVEGSSPLRKR
jgi:hypothetical protein